MRTYDSLLLFEIVSIFEDENVEHLSQTLTMIENAILSVYESSDARDDRLKELHCIVTYVHWMLPESRHTKSVITGITGSNSGIDSWFEHRVHAAYNKQDNAQR